MRKIIFVFLICFITQQVCSQGNYYIYIQAEDNKPFYVRSGSKTFHSSGNGYLLIPDLANDTYELTIGFSDGVGQEWKFKCTLSEKDLGFILRNNSSRGVELSGFKQEKGLTGIKIDNKPDKKANTVKQAVGIVSEDPFSTMLAEVVNDPTIKQQPTIILKASDSLNLAKVAKKDSVAGTVAVNNTKPSDLKKDENKISSAIDSTKAIAASNAVTLAANRKATEEANKKKADSLIAVAKTADSIARVKRADSLIAVAKTADSIARVKKADSLIAIAKTADSIATVKKADRLSAVAKKADSIARIKRADSLIAVAKTADSIARVKRADSLIAVAKTADSIARIKKADSLIAVAKTADSIARVKRADSFIAVAKTADSIARIKKADGLSAVAKKADSIARIKRADSLIAVAKTADSIARIKRADSLIAVAKTADSIARVKKADSLIAVAKSDAANKNNTAIQPDTKKKADSIAAASTKPAVGLPVTEQPKKVTAPSSVSIKKTLQRKSADGVELIYVDETSDGTKETIRILIPASN